jgi:hypothetical protein
VVPAELLKWNMALEVFFIWQCILHDTFIRDDAMVTKRWRWKEICLTHLEVLAAKTGCFCMTVV